MARTAQTRRVLLGKRRAFGSQQRTYRTADYLEIDDVEYYYVTRRRILYDEILLVTLHGRRPWLSAIGVGVLGILLGLAGLAVLTIGTVAALFFFGPGAVMVALAVLTAARPRGVVTVFGKRTRAQMEFWQGDRQAREAYQLVCRLARERQAQLARQAAPAAPPEPTTTAAPQDAQKPSAASPLTARRVET